MCFHASVTSRLFSADHVSGKQKSQSIHLTRSPSNALLPLCLGGSPIKIDKKEKSWSPYSHLSNLEDLVELFTISPFLLTIQAWLLQEAVLF